MPFPIPSKGKSRDEVMATLREYRAGDPDWSQGKIFGYVFHGDDDIVATVEEAFRFYMWDNMLDPSVFPSLLRLETEVVAMAADHLGGDAEVCGNFTSGGTESCLLAVKAARDWARATKPAIAEPEMILPVTAHPAFHKAAHYFDVKAVTVPIDPVTMRADMDAVKAAISPNTIMLVASATCFAFGTTDPVPEFAALAKTHDLWLHVDGCIGGFLLGLYKRMGRDVPPFDFSVDGVCSMSMDLHKYALAAKGASVVLYRNKQLRKYQIFTHSGWTGYTMINPTIQSTKSGGPLAGAWAVMQYVGQERYQQIAADLWSAAERFIQGIADIPELYIMGKPDIPLLGVGTKGVDLFALCDALKARGWHVGPQPGAMGIPESFHMTILPFNLDRIDELVADVHEAVAEVRGQDISPMVRNLAEMAKSIDPDTIDDAMVANLLSMVGVGGQGNGLPKQMAEINQLMNVLPPKLVDKLLTAFYNDWNRYKG